MSSTAINWNRYDYYVNVDFFKNWTYQMAYVLGFTFADGSVYKTTLAWDLRGDKELLVKINGAMESNYPIKKRKASCRLRISNPILIYDLNALGLFPNKSKDCKFPVVPKKFLNHFIRGFFDGDGWFTIRKNRQEISVGFANGSYKFLAQLANALASSLPISRQHLRAKKKITKAGKNSVTYELDYHCRNAYEIMKFLYEDLGKDDLYMKRKYEKYLEAKNLYEFILSGGRKYREVQRKYGDMENLLRRLLVEKGLDGVQIAKRLNVHSSSVYRWLAKTGVRIPARRTRWGNNKN